MNENTKNSIEMGSEKSFGIVFGIFFLILMAINPFDLMIVWGFCSILFFLLAFIKPSFLKPFNKIWFHFGLLLHKIINPIILGIIFFLVITPIGLLLRTKDILNLKFDKTAKSYWIKKDNKIGTMKNQF